MPKRKASRVDVPSNLKSLSKADLISLVRLLDAERGTSKKAKKEPDTAKLKKALARKLISAIKKAKLRTQNAKPWCEVHEGVSLEYAKKFVGEIGTEFKDTKRLWVKKLAGSEISELLPQVPAVNQATWTGKTWNFGGRSSGKVFTEVIFDEGEAKYDKSSNMLTIRVRVIKKPYNWSTPLKRKIDAASKEKLEKEEKPEKEEKSKTSKINLFETEFELDKAQWDVHYPRIHNCINAIKLSEGYPHEVSQLISSKNTLTKKGMKLFDNPSSFIMMNTKYANRMQEFFDREMKLIKKDKDLQNKSYRVLMTLIGLNWADILFNDNDCDDDLQTFLDELAAVISDLRKEKKFKEEIKAINHCIEAFREQTLSGSNFEDCSNGTFDI